MRVRRLLAFVTSFGAVVGMTGGAYFLGRRATQTTTVPVVASAPATVVARYGTLEDTRRVQVSAKWKPEQKMFNRLAGTVTSIGVASTGVVKVEEGAILYSVDALAVIAASGNVPMYRAIGDGTSGTDVEQLQRFLVRAGLAVGEIDGVWGNATVRAWNAWQRTTGRPVTSRVELGEVMFVPDLPRTMSADEGLVVGRPVTGSESLVALFQAVPALWLTSPADAAVAFIDGTDVDVVVGTEKVFASLSSRRTNTDRGVQIELDFATRCGPWCSNVRSDGSSTFVGAIRVSKPVTGTIVPIGTLHTGTGSGSAVVLPDGTIRDVVVLTKVGAEAVVDGVAAGESLQVPGAAATSAPRP
jgi:peptidoglycan hydrolase-like protein with peptidoglycan-binding domain